MIEYLLACLAIGGSIFLIIASEIIRREFQHGLEFDEDCVYYDHDIGTCSRPEHWCHCEHWGAEQ